MWNSWDVMYVMGHDSMNEMMIFIELNATLFSPRLALFCFSCTWHLLEYCLLLNVFIICFHNLNLPLPIQPHLMMLCAWLDLHATVVLHYGPWVILLHLYDFAGSHRIMLKCDRSRSHKEWYFCLFKKITKLNRTAK